MPNAAQILVDPLAAFMDGAVDAEQRPVPLVSTRFDVRIAAGLAVVSAVRVFRNAEARPIEATITLPVPVQAQVFGLSARIGERWLQAVAKSQKAARETYEDAIDRGKAAVLHEEALRGVHVLSVAHIAPGEAVEVRMEWVETLRLSGQSLKLRIPTTVGEIYGRSPLAEPDELHADGPEAMAEIVVHAEGRVWLGGAPMEAGRANTPLNRPIDLEVNATLPRSLVGVSAVGDPVRLTFDRTGDDTPLDLAILVDRSGSMQTACAADSERTKHQAVIEGLSAAAASLGRADHIRLWQFDDRAQALGGADGHKLTSLIRKLGPPRGGTEIGAAIEAVLAAGGGRDLLVITDGQSHALDVQALARRGLRISAVLVGEDSLEARIGHLAALTGGQIFVAADHDIPAVTASALAALRGAPADRIAAGSLRAARAGLVLEAVWEKLEAAPAPENPGLARAVGALVAALRLATLDEEEAARLAEAEGLVTHLTSLVLVDEASATQESLPALRKVALPEPAVAMVCEAYSGPYHLSDVPKMRHLALRSDSYGEAIPSFLLSRLATPMARPASVAPDWLGDIDWREHGALLAACNLACLPLRAAEGLRAFAGTDFAGEYAGRLGLTPLVFAILAAALLAERAGDRGAARVVRRLLRRGLLGRRPRSDLPPIPELELSLLAV